MSLHTQFVHSSKELQAIFLLSLGQLLLLILSSMEYSSSCSKKSRKPYTLTKPRESWSNDEHERFIKALALYNRDWKKIETYVGTKTVVQIRSHAQKYFQKVMKSGIPDAIPPPRAKRRASEVPNIENSKHARLLSSEAPSRQGSGREDDSDEGMQQHFHSSSKHHQAHEAAQHEPSAQLEAARAHISSEGLQHVYLFLAALFSQQQPDFAAMLQRLTMRDRHLVTVLLTSLVEELNQQQQQHAFLQPDQPQQQQEEANHAEEQQQPQHGQHANGSSGSGGQQPGAPDATGTGTAAAAAAAAAVAAAPSDAAAPANTPDAAAAADGAAGFDAGMPAAAAVDEQEEGKVPAPQRQQQQVVQEVQQQPQEQQHVEVPGLQPAQPQQQQQQGSGLCEQQQQAGPDAQQQQQRQQPEEVCAVADPQQEQPVQQQQQQPQAVTTEAATAEAAEGVQQPQLDDTKAAGRDADAAAGL